MSKRLVLSKKFVLVVLMLGIGLAILPAASASAAGLADETNPPARQVDTSRLEAAYARLNECYTHQTTWMGKAEANIARVQNLINAATARGYDASAVQSALDAFAAAYPNAKAYNEQAAAILAVHAGFDENGTVTDSQPAIETLRSLHTALKTAHDTMNGTGQALKAALRAFRDANKPPVRP